MLCVESWRARCVRGRAGARAGAQRAGRCHGTMGRALSGQSGLAARWVSLASGGAASASSDPDPFVGLIGESFFHFEKYSGVVTSYSLLITTTVVVIVCVVAFTITHVTHPCLLLYVNSFASMCISMLLNKTRCGRQFFGRFSPQSDRHAQPYRVYSRIR